MVLSIIYRFTEKTYLQNLLIAEEVKEESVWFCQ